MKKLILPLITGLLFTGFPLNTYAIDPDPVVTATATAELVEALSATEVNQLNFGRFIAGESGGTIVIANTAAGTVNVTGTVATIGGGSPSSASFSITGRANAEVTVSLPADGAVNLTHTASGNAMNVASFSVSDSSPTLSATGEATIYVGGTLTVPNTDISKGIYTGTYTVTFAYQ
ncbi:MAG: DUF4402 domain-containing protein [Bacteroidales bacterium]|jgi:hypothetical protein|nr:DUF4402 domain-containing protein [Bacteroidales bacterium]MDD2263565.1 DUF4402 domain-containing protein [Bacteroidales bacterium]MDD2830644.1 DUF4402 domain-containing protein [Bacteroidales bacterium]MDD3207843.1 DUF4402 domain-containing protein [Bacteroidales bacterium]MDD3696649.1 DUF4402 domain-containing protein [Bacteroidales bacterium]